MMREGNIFSLFTLRGVPPSSWWGGGYPILPDMGYPILPNQGYPSFMMGYPHPSQRGYPWWRLHPSFLLGEGAPVRTVWGKPPPLSGLDGGTPVRTGWGKSSTPIRTGWVISPSRIGWGYLLVRTGWGYLPYWDWIGFPPPSLETPQQGEHLLRSRRYASCVHAGGLSCLILLSGLDGVNPQPLSGLDG